MQGDLHGGVPCDHVDDGVGTVIAHIGSAVGGRLPSVLFHVWRMC